MPIENPIPQKELNTPLNRINWDAVYPTNEESLKRFRNEGTNKRLESVYDLISKKVGPVETLLDIGFYDGRFIPLLPAQHVDGIDVSAKNTLLAKDKLSDDIETGRVNLFTLDATHLLHDSRFADSKYDAATLIEVLVDFHGPISSIEEVIEGARRVVKDNGVLVVSAGVENATLPKEWWRFKTSKINPKKLEQMLIQQGFPQIEWYGQIFLKNPQPDEPGGIQNPWRNAPDGSPVFLPDAFIPKKLYPELSPSDPKDMQMYQEGIENPLYVIAVCR